MLTIFQGLTFILHTNTQSAINGFLDYLQLCNDTEPPSGRGTLPGCSQTQQVERRKSF